MTTFQLYLTDSESGTIAEVPIARTDHELLCRQLTRCLEYGDLDLFARWLGSALGSSLPSAVDCNLRPPSDAQVSFAMAIARTLGVALEPEVLRYRGEMHDFLSSHKEAFDARRRAHSQQPTGAVDRTEAQDPGFD